MLYIGESGLRATSTHHRRGAASEETVIFHSGASYLIETIGSVITLYELDQVAGITTRDEFGRAKTHDTAIRLVFAQEASRAQA